MSRKPRPPKGFENVEGGFLDDLPNLLDQLRSENLQRGLANGALSKWEDNDDEYDVDAERAPSAELVRLSEWGYRPIEWLWPGMVPLRKVTLLVGDPERGKTFLALDLAARLSRGEMIPPDPPTHERAGVVILSADDELDDTLVPRLEEAGADLAHVYALTNDGPKHCGEARAQISLADGVEELDAALKSVGNCKLVVIDPITAFLDGMSSNSHIAVRRLLARLGSVARRHQAAVLLISHNRKDGGASACHRVIGSLAFTAAARVVYALVEDPAIAERRLLLPVKMNLQQDAAGRAFRIVEGRLEWEIEPVSLRPDELRRLAASGVATADRVDRVAAKLLEFLADGPRSSREVHEAAREQRVPRTVLFAAKAQAGIKARFDGELREWVWERV